MWCRFIQCLVKLHQHSQTIISDFFPLMCSFTSGYWLCSSYIPLYVLCFFPLIFIICILIYWFYIFYIMALSLFELIKFCWILNLSKPYSLIRLWMIQYFLRFLLASTLWALNVLTNVSHVDPIHIPVFSDLKYFSLWINYFHFWIIYGVCLLNIYLYLQKFPTNFDN